MTVVSRAAAAALSLTSFCLPALAQPRNAAPDRCADLTEAVMEAVVNRAVGRRQAGLTRFDDHPFSAAIIRSVREDRAAQGHPDDAACTDAAIRIRLYTYDGLADTPSTVDRLIPAQPPVAAPKTSFRIPR